MISLRVPSGSSPAVSRKSWVKRSSTLMSLFLQHADRAFRAVGRGQPCFLFLAGRNGPVAEDLPVALVVLTEQVRGQVVAAAMPLAAVGLDLQFHALLPSCGPVLARPVTTRASRAAHSSVPTACRSGVT